MQLRPAALEGVVWLHTNLALSSEAWLCLTWCIECPNTSSVSSTMRLCLLIQGLLVCLRRLNEGLPQKIRERMAEGGNNGHVLPRYTSFSSSRHPPISSDLTSFLKQHIGAILPRGGVEVA